MKNAKHLLNLCFSIALSSCAEASIVKVNVIQERPQSAVCVAGDQGAQCYDPRTTPKAYAIPSLKNYVCYPPADNQALEEWIKVLKRAAE